MFNVYGLVCEEAQRGNLSSRNCSLDEVDFVASAFEFGCVEKWQQGFCFVAWNGCYGVVVIGVDFAHFIH